MEIFLSYEYQCGGTILPKGNIMHSFWQVLLYTNELKLTGSTDLNLSRECFAPSSIEDLRKFPVAPSVPESYLLGLSA